MATLEIVVTVDEDGNFKLGGNDSNGDLVEAFDDLDSGQATRTILLKLEVEAAKPLELTAKIPADLPSGIVTITASPSED